MSILVPSVSMRASDGLVGTAATQNLKCHGCGRALTEMPYSQGLLTPQSSMAYTMLRPVLFRASRISSNCSRTPCLQGAHMLLSFISQTEIQAIDGGWSGKLAWYAIFHQVPVSCNSLQLDADSCETT